jgi:hypothetical protein
MEIQKFIEPFTYYIIDDIITMDENKQIYDTLISNNYNRDEPLKHSQGLQVSFQDIEKKIYDSLDNIILENLNSNDGNWRGGFQEHFDAVLSPHTDWRYHNLKNMGYGTYTEDTETDDIKLIDSGGVIKGLLYIGDPTLNYLDYGTKIYTHIPARSVHVEETYSHEEVKFKPCRAIVFVTSENSFHGTEFSSGFPYKRYTYGFEYYPKKLLKRLG